MVTDSKPSHYRMEFESLDEMLDTIAGRSYQGASVESDDAEWSGTDTYKEAEELARNGWEEGLERIADLRDDLHDMVGRTLPEPQPIMDVSGFDVDVGAYVSGEPEHMVSWMDLEDGKRQIHLVYNTAMSAFVTPDAIMMRGALVAALVDAMESLGHRVRVDAALYIQPSTFGAAGDSTDSWNTQVTIKRESEVLDLERLVYSTAHPSMLRRIGFAAMEFSPRSIRDRYGLKSGGGYGMPSDPPEDSPERGELYVGSIFPDDMADALDKTLEYLRVAGVLET